MTMIDFQAGLRALSTFTPRALAPAEPFEGAIQEESALFGGIHRLGTIPWLVDQMGADLQPILFSSVNQAFGSDVEPSRVAVYPEYDVTPYQQGLEPHVRKIAVLRSNGIGDFIFALPALTALRLAYPQAEIVLLGLHWHADFLTGRPGPVDRVIVVPRSRGVREPSDYLEDPAEMDAFFEQMAGEHFDIALQMHGGGRYSNPFVKRLGARLTVGFRAADAEPLDRWVPYTFYQSEIMRYLEVVSLVGARLTSLEPRIIVTEADVEEAAQWIALDERPIAVLHPGAGDPRRRWPTEKYAAVGNALAWAGAQVTIVGNEGDHPLGEGVIHQMSAPALNLCGQLSLNGLTGLLSRASVVVSNDSGPLHLAAAVGAATVGIYWCGNMITASPITRTRHRPSISWTLDCPVCGLNCTRYSCDHRESFVAEVSQEEVTASALELLSLFRKPASEPILATL